MSKKKQRHLLRFLWEGGTKISAGFQVEALTDILIWITIAVPTIYFAIKKDISKLAMVLVIPVIFILIGLMYSLGNLINNI